MSKLAKRLLFVVGFFPAMIYAFLRWIATGKSALSVLDAFDQWVNE